MHRVMIRLLGKKKEAHATRCHIGRAGLNGRSVCPHHEEVVIARPKPTSLARRYFVTECRFSGDGRPRFVH